MHWEFGEAHFYFFITAVSLISSGLFNVLRPCYYYQVIWRGNGHPTVGREIRRKVSFLSVSFLKRAKQCRLSQYFLLIYEFKTSYSQGKKVERTDAPHSSWPNPTQKRFFSSVNVTVTKETTSHTFIVSTPPSPANIVKRQNVKVIRMSTRIDAHLH